MPAVKTEVASECGRVFPVTRRVVTRRWHRLPVTWARLGPEEDSMLDLSLTAGGWALVCALIYFSGRWAEKEREVFGHGDVSWGCLG